MTIALLPDIRVVVEMSGGLLGFHRRCEIAGGMLSVTESALCNPPARTSRPLSYGETVQIALAASAVTGMTQSDITRDDDITGTETYQVDLTVAGVARRFSWSGGDRVPEALTSLLDSVVRIGTREVDGPSL